MGLTVEQLTRLPQLQTSFLAGRGGGERAVLWAHSCEVPDPWQWLGTGDLLLTSGFGFPVGDEEQANYLRDLAAANLSGIAIGQGMGAAPLSARARALADELDFPVLRTAYSVPFVALARAVADSNTHDISRRLYRILRVYDVLRRSTGENGHGRGRLLDSLADETGTRLCVLDLADGTLPLGPGEVPPVAISAVLAGMHTPPLPAISRIGVGEDTAMVLPLSDRSHAVLVAIGRDTRVLPDLVVLQHVVTIVETEVERLAGSVLRRRMAGTRLFSQLIEAALPEAVSRERLEAHLGGAGPWTVVAAEVSDLDHGSERLLARLRSTQCGHVSVTSATELLVLVRALDESAVVAALGQTTPQTPRPRLGLSTSVLVPGRVPDAVREARWALEAARLGRRHTSRYGEQTPMFLPSTVAEGEVIVDRVLGALLSYDTAHDAGLMRTLCAYLDANRSVQQAAEAVGVHKQTVNYRLKRVESLTGRGLQDLAHLTELFMAVRTWRMLQTGLAD